MSHSRSLMRYRTNIQRSTLASDGGGGYSDDWGDIATDVPCYAWMMSSSETMEGGDRPEEIDMRTVIMPLGTAIEIGDQLDEIVDRQGALKFDGPLSVDGIGERLDYIQLTTKRVS
jgi:hypothetical protein